MPPIATETFCLLSDAMVVAILLNGLRLALRRSELTSASRVRLGLGMAATLLSWNVVSFIMATNGVFVARRAAFHAAHGAAAKVTRILFAAFPPILFAVILPTVIGLWLIFRSKALAKVVDATPLSWLVGAQVYRVMGAIFLVLWGAGELPWQFALPAGVGDVLVGVIAVPVAWAARRGSKASHAAAYAWNVLGILDFLVALGTGFLTSPSRFQMLALNHPNLLASRYPLVMIPAFLVPLSSIMHGICLWKLRRMAQTAAWKSTSFPTGYRSALQESEN